VAALRLRRSAKTAVSASSETPESEDNEEMYDLFLEGLRIEESQ
jgi:hypothetical protein